MGEEKIMKYTFVFTDSELYVKRVVHADSIKEVRIKENEGQPIQLIGYLTIEEAQEKIWKMFLNK